MNSKYQKGKFFDALLKLSFNDGSPFFINLSAAPAEITYALFAALPVQFSGAAVPAAFSGRLACVGAAAEMLTGETPEKAGETPALLNHAFALFAVLVLFFD